MYENSTSIVEFTNGEKIFTLKADALWVQDQDKSRKLAGHINLIGQARDENSNEWTLIIEMVDGDGHKKQIEIPKRLLASDPRPILERLLDAGLPIFGGNKTHRDLIEFLRMHPTASRLRLLKRIGWHGSGYMTPHNFIGPHGSELPILRTPARSISKFAVKGTLADWIDHVALPCGTNSRLVFTLSAAFAAPLIHLLGQESGGFHFFGPSSVGKTTALHIAASVYGSPKEGYIHQWRTTTNAADYLCAGHNDALLILDEISQCPPDDVSKMIYQMANNRGKNRANADDTLRAQLSWRLLILSTGEFEVSRYLEQPSRQRRAKAGQLVRLIDISADAGCGLGIFDSTGDFKTGDEFARHLKAASEENHGTAILAYLEALCINPGRATEVSKQYQDEFVFKLRAEGASGEILRQLQRFGMVYAGGRLAADFGIVPFPPDSIRDSIESCFQDSIAGRAGQDSSEEIQILEHFKNFLNLYGKSRFEPLGPHASTPNLIERWGYVRTVGESSIWYIPSPTFRQKFCEGFNFSQVIEVLRGRNLLEVDSEGKSSIPLSTPQGKIRVFGVKSSIMSE